MNSTEKTYKIYKIPVKFKLDKIHAKSINRITEQFDRYEQTTEKEKICIILSRDNFPKAKLNNPSLHALIQDGFCIHYPKYNIAYSFKDEILQIQIQLKHQGNSAIRYLKKLYNIQYNSLEERAVQIIWENCLYPAFYFFKNYSIIHSSGFSVDNKQALLLGGTGGVGKTSLELALAKNEKFGFLNDDIAVVDDTGNIHPNLSWPKIYAYNIIDNPRIKKMILKNRALHDKLAYHFKKQVFGLNKVRRTIDPEVLFSQPSKQALPLKKFIYLSRGSYSELKLKFFPKELVPKLNIEIIKSEFSDFERHLNWHVYNSELKGETPIVKTKESHQNWERIQSKVFDNCDCYIMEIPIKIDHTTFVKQASKLIEELFG